MRMAFAYLFALAPLPLKRFIARHLYKWDIHPTAYIGPSVLTVRTLSMGPGASIGGRNVITNLDELRMGEGATIGSGNMIKGWWDHPTQKLPGRNPSVHLAEGAQIASYHYIDCVDALELGRHAAIAGFRSTVLTHSIDLVRDKYVSGAVALGDYAVVMSGCLLSAGTRIPARSVVAAGSVVSTRLTEELTFYRGNPAEAVRPLPERMAFFHRGEPCGIPPAAAPPRERERTRADGPSGLSPTSPSRPRSGRSGGWPVPETAP
jgi:acetyltransferase-like isoleucine patch superfamily enzyme